MSDDKKPHNRYSDEVIDSIFLLITEKLPLIESSLAVLVSKFDTHLITYGKHIETCEKRHDPEKQSEIQDRKKNTSINHWMLISNVLLSSLALIIAFWK